MAGYSEEGVAEQSEEGVAEQSEEGVEVHSEEGVTVHSEGVTKSVVLGSSKVGGGFAPIHGLLLGRVERVRW